MATRTPETVIREIIAGKLDEVLLDIVKAAQTRFMVGAVAVRWQIDIGTAIGGDPNMISEDDLTLDEAFRIESISGAGWLKLNPTSSAQDCRAIILALLESRRGMSEDAAVEALKPLKLSTVFDLISNYQVTEETADPLSPAS